MIERLKGQVRRYWLVFLAVLGVIAMGLAVGSAIVVRQNFVWPWEDFYEVSAEFRTAQAVAPGQGQSVMIAGVVVGDVKSVELEGGVAVVTVRIENRYAPIYRNAAMTLRPRTAAQDMNIALDRGTPRAGELPDGGLLPSSQTQPNVNTDEVFATLDADTRSYLQMLISGVGRGVDGDAAALRKVLAATNPTVSASRRVSRVLAARRAQIGRLVHNLNRVSRAVAMRQQDVSTTIDATGESLAALARQDDALRESLDLLPGTLAQAESALRHGGRLARALRPAAAALRPVARELKPALGRAEPVLREGTPIVRSRLRPLVRDAIPVVRSLQPSARDIRATLPHLEATTPRVNRLVDMLLHDPPGDERGYLYYLPWFAHNLNSVMSAEDAHGAFVRGLVVFSCSDLEVIQDFINTIPELDLDLPPVNTLPACGGP